MTIPNIHHGTLPKKIESTPVAKNDKRYSIIKKVTKVAVIAFIVLAVIGFLALAPLLLMTAGISLGVAAGISAGIVFTGLAGAIASYRIGRHLRKGPKFLTQIPKSELSKMDDIKRTKIRMLIDLRIEDLESKNKKKHPEEIESKSKEKRAKEIKALKSKKNEINEILNERLKNLTYLRHDAD
jgi:hypothetical protein